MKETNRHDEMLKVQRDREEADQKVKKGDMTEEEALEINLKATLKSFGLLIDEFEAADAEVQRRPQERSHMFRRLDEPGRRKCEGDWRLNWHRLKG